PETVRGDGGRRRGPRKTRGGPRCAVYRLDPAEYDRSTGFACNRAAPRDARRTLSAAASRTRHRGSEAGHYETRGGHRDTARTADGPSLVCRKLGEVGFGLYASPRYLAEHGSPQRGQGLAGHRLISYVGNPASGFGPLFMGEALAGAQIALCSN